MRRIQEGLHEVVKGNDEREQHFNFQEAGRSTSRKRFQSVTAETLELCTVQLSESRTGCGLCDLAAVPPPQRLVFVGFLQFE